MEMVGKIGALVLAFAILTGGVLGVVAMGAMDHSNGHPCFLSVGTSECPTQVSVLTALAHHIGGIQEMSQAVPVLLLTILALVFIASVALIRARLWLVPFSLLVQQTTYVLRTQLKIHQHIASPLASFLQWSALHRSLNPHASVRVHDENRSANTVSPFMVLT